MSRLIRYDDAIERLGVHLMADAQIDWGGTASTDIEDWKELADMILNGVPTIDAVEVVRGEWKHDGSVWTYRFNCTNCGYHLLGRQTNYCPNCGAKMDGERKESE